MRPDYKLSMTKYVHRIGKLQRKKWKNEGDKET